MHTQKLIESIKELAVQGKTRKVIAAITGLSYSNIVKIVRSYKIECQRECREPPLKYKNMPVMLQRLIDRGWLHEEIAAFYMFSKECLPYHLRKYKIKQWPLTVRQFIFNEITAKIRNEYAQGISARDLMKKYNMSASGILLRVKYNDKMAKTQ